MVKGIVIIGVVSVICSCFPACNPVVLMLIKGLVSVIISGVLIMVFSLKSEYLGETLLMLKGVLKH